MKLFRLQELHGYSDGQACVGFDQQGQRLIIDTQYQAHMVISGTSGGGKGGFARILQCNDLAQHAQVIVIQPKPGENGWLAGAATIATEAETITEALAYVVDEQDRRQQRISDQLDPETGIYGVDNYTELINRPHRIVVYIDEISAVAGPQAFLRFSKEAVAANTEAIGEIAQRGRSAGISLRIMTQRPTLLGTFGNSTLGGGIFSSLQQRFHFDRDAESLKAAFSHCEAIRPRVMQLISQGHAGRCAYVFARPEDGGQVKAGQVVWVTKEQALPFARDYEGPLPLQLPITKTFHPQEQ